MPLQASSTTDFVQDYAAKRAAQIERARKLREDRQLHQQQQQQPQQPQPQPQGLSFGNPGSSARRPSGSSGAAPAVLTASPTRRIVHLVEDDFKRATRAGIITPDQARQLWAMLSEQIVHVGSGANATGSSLVSSTAGSTDAELAVSPAGQNGQNVAFRGSISMDSLRASIAQFKEQQRRKQFGAKSQATHGGGNVENSAQDVYESSARGFTSTGAGAVTGTVGNVSSRLPRREIYAEDDEPSVPHAHAQQVQKQKEFEGDEGDNFAMHRGIPSHKGRREKAKPAWNFDVDVGYADAPPAVQEAPPPKSQSKHSAQHHTKRAPTKRDGGGTANAMPLQSLGGTSAVTASSHTSHPEGRSVHSQPGRNASKKKSPWTSVSPEIGIVDIDNMVVGGSGDGGIPEEQASEPLIPCGLCGRTFRTSVLARHEKVCQQMQKKRRTFDVKGMRMDGIEGMKEVQATTQPPLKKRQLQQQQQPQQQVGKLPKWKIQHEQFQAAMRAMKQVDNEGGNAKSGYTAGKGMSGKNQMAPPPAPVPEAYDDRVPCPHCGRKFAEITAQRHIPMCAKTIAKPKGIRPTRR